MQHHRLIASFFTILFLALLPSSPRAESTSRPDAATALALKKWRKEAVALAPMTIGCFALQYPSKEWKKVDCGKPPSRAPRYLMLKKPSRITPHVELVTGDYTMTPTNSISSATGEIAALINVTTVGSIKTEDGTLANGMFSLQLNSNMTLPASSGNPSCATSSNKQCKGWIQFVYDSDRNLTVQYWFINYLKDSGESCPSGAAFSSGLSCGANAIHQTLPSTFSNDFRDLQHASLTGRAANGKVSVTFTIAGNSRTITVPDPVGASGSGWTQAEFNVFGYGTIGSGSSTESYSEVAFNPQAQITIGLTSDNDSSGEKPVCAGGTTTGEFSNLYLQPCFTNTTPGISFNESPMCAFDEYCPFYEGQPPTYAVKCNAPSDFYNYSGLPANPAAPTGLTPVQANTTTNTGLMTSEDTGLAACLVGTKSNCYMHSIETAQANWCINRGPPPPPPRCSQCPNQRCCMDPNGGPRPLCLPLNSTCPHVR